MRKRKRKRPRRSQCCQDWTEISMPSFHADPDCLPTAHSPPPLYQLSSEHSTAATAQSCLTVTAAQPRFLWEPRESCAGTTCVTDCVSWGPAVTAVTAVSCQPGLLVLLYLTMLPTWTSSLHSWSDSTDLHHHSDLPGPEWMSRPPPQCDPRQTHPAPPAPPAPSSCIRMYKLHSSSPHSPALLFVLLYIFHVKN